jgi:RNA polymerase sigma-70 factor (ECF subfamily)
MNATDFTYSNNLPPTTSVVLEAFKNGDEAAAKIVFKQYYPLVLNRLRSIVSNAIDAEDIVQNAFLKLWVGRKCIDVERGLLPYLYAITRNEMISFYRKQRAMPSDDLPDQLFAPSNTEGDEQLIVKELQQLIDQKVDNMPPQRKACYLYSRIEGLPNEMIAEKLHITKNAVEKQITYALNDLRKTLTIALRP